VARPCRIVCSPEATAGREAESGVFENRRGAVLAQGRQGAGNLAVSIRGLARRHKVHRRTVRQAIAAALPPARKVPPRAAPPVRRHKATIRAWLTDDLAAPRKQRHTARRVWEWLVDEQGGEVGESTVRAVVAAVTCELESGTALVTVPQAHPPGAEAEVDVGDATVVIAGLPVKVEIFHLRLSHSGAVHVAFPSEGQEALLEGHVLAFARLGGYAGGGCQGASSSSRARIPSKIWWRPTWLRISRVLAALEPAHR
jgi:hypothetical protein